MTSYRIIIAFGGLVVSSLAAAQYSSPELMLVADAGDGTSAHPRQIERYDPYTGAYLGAFGAGYFQGTPIGVSVIGQDAYVTDTFTVNGTEYSRVYKFNFSTGAYDGSIFSSFPYQLTSVNAYGGNVIVGDYGNGLSGNPTGSIYTLNSTGAIVGSVSLPTNVVTNGATIVGSQLWVATVNLNAGSAGSMLVYNLNSNGTINGGPTSVGTPGGGFVSTTNATINGSQYVFAGGYDAGLNGVIYRYTTAGAYAGSQTLSAGRNTAWSIAAGHNGMLYNYGLGSNVITRYDGASSFGYGPLGSFTLTNTTYAENIAVYAAPEPVSMTLLGLGAVGLIARRRRKH